MKIVAETVVKFLLDNVVFCDRMLLYKQNKTPPVNVTVHTSKLQNRQIPILYFNCMKYNIQHITTEYLILFVTEIQHEIQQSCYLDLGTHCFPDDLKT